jgi:hypothetical protein
VGGGPSSSAPCIHTYRMHALGLHTVQALQMAFCRHILLSPQQDPSPPALIDPSPAASWGMGMEAADEALHGFQGVDRSILSIYFPLALLSQTVIHRGAVVAGGSRYELLDRDASFCLLLLRLTQHGLARLSSGITVISTR